MKYRLPEIFLGVFLAVAIFAMGMLFSSSFLPLQHHYSSDQKKAETSARAESKQHGFWEKAADDPVAYFTLWLVGFTGVLAFSTIGLWFVTNRGVKIQARDTRILQRAYINVKPADVRDATDGSLIGHVKFRNVGRLPASKFMWHLDLTPNDSDDWQPPTVADEKLRNAGVLSIKTEIKRGGPGRVIPTEKFLYVWGRIVYENGFGEQRFTNFCFRYNTEVKETPPGGGYLIRATHARHHDYGNDAN